MAVRRVRPVVPPLGAVTIPVAARRPALAALGELRRAATWLGNPDLFHRPRLRTLVHRRHIDGLSAEETVALVAQAAEERAAAGLAAVQTVRSECARSPGTRPCFEPDSLAELHRLLAAADPSIPGQGGFRQKPSHVTWSDGRRFAIDVAPGRALREQIDAWYRWAVETTSPPLDAAAFSMVRLMTIHPFADANGRTARLLAQCDLVAAGLMPGLLLDLEAWVHGHRTEFDEAVVAASAGRWPQWGDVFARAVTDTARHRVTTISAYREMLEAVAVRAGDDPPAQAVLAQLRFSPAVSADWLLGRIPGDSQPALTRLRDAGLLSSHPRLPGALIHPGLIAILDEPFSVA